MVGEPGSSRQVRPGLGPNAVRLHFPPTLASSTCQTMSTWWTRTTSKTALSGNSFPTSTLSTAWNIGSGGANHGYGSGPDAASVGPTGCSSGHRPSTVSAQDMSDLDKVVRPYPYLCYP
ncbi:hypothetical protein SAY86_017314 [Trapa natans]|uniref:Uncharacterized protein n=1 Tax=Trapa natans TaxID=22666 RepID=A0AAN7R6C4_TRANT|nr:hypothetical protein SAY86_017314 [Trapa natans]